MFDAFTPSRLNCVLLLLVSACSGRAADRSTPGAGGSASARHPDGGSGGVPDAATGGGTGVCEGYVCDHGVGCVHGGESCPVLDAGVDANIGDARPPEQPAVCVLSSESTIPGVHIEFPSQPCAFTLRQASQGIRFSYDVVVDDDLPGYSSRPATVGVLMYPGGDVAKLQIATVIEGGIQRYCVCDQGGPPPFCTLQDGGFSTWLPSPPEPNCAPITLTKGVSNVTWPSLVYEGPIAWHGRNWDGPSDTANPEGAQFPPGDYELKITIAGRLTRDGGTVDVDASARFLVRLVP